MTTRGYFITGTETGVGKTVFTSAFARTLLDAGRNVAAYKPVCSGAESGKQGPVWSDVETLSDATAGRWPRERIGPQTFLAPLSPPTAAALEGREVDEALLLAGFDWLAERTDLVLVEGAGGFYSPLSTNWLNADLAERLGLPVIIVSPNRLGTINQTLLTVAAVRQRGLRVAGVVLNRLTEVGDGSVITNAGEISKHGAVRIWGEIPFTRSTELQSTRLPESMVKELGTSDERECQTGVLDLPDAFCTTSQHSVIHSP